MGVGFIIISRQAGLVPACKNRCEKKVRLIDIHKYYIPDAARTDLKCSRLQIMQLLQIAVSPSFIRGTFPTIKCRLPISACSDQYIYW
jgi:hypothetical protein